MVSLTFHSPSHSPAGAGHRSILSRLTGPIESFRQEWQVRTAIRMVEAMDSHMLMDLGISAGGIEDAVRHGR